MPLNIKDLRPKIFDVDPRSSEARKQWTHWYKSFTCYIAKYGDISVADELNLLINHVNAAVHEIISGAASFSIITQSLSWKEFMQQPLTQFFIAIMQAATWSIG